MNEIDYQAYVDQNISLNLSIWNNEIQINYEIKESLSEQIDLIKSFKV